MTVPAQSGDFIVQFRFDGRCDLLQIGQAGERVMIRGHLASPQEARRLFRTATPAGAQLWICDEATPGKLDLY